MFHQKAKQNSLNVCDDKFLKSGVGLAPSYNFIYLLLSSDMELELEIKSSSTREPILETFSYSILTQNRVRDQDGPHLALY